MVMSFILILVPMALVAWSVLYLVQQHLSQDANAQLQSDLSAASLYFQGQVEKTRSAILTVARDNVVKTTLRLDIAGQLQRHLAELREQLGLDFLIVLDPEGQARVSYIEEGARKTGYASVDFSDHPVSSSVKPGTGLACTLLEDHPFLLSLLERQGKSIESRPVVIVEAAARIVLRDEFLGTILGGFLVTDNQDLLDEIEEIAGVAQVEFVAADRMVSGGDIIDTATGRRQVFFPVPLDYVHHDPPGVENPIKPPFSNVKKVYDYLPLSVAGQESDLAIVVERSQADFLQVLESIRRVLLSVFAAAVVAALGAAFFMSRSIARPLQEVARSMRTMRQGGEFTPLASQRDDEVGTLINGYNGMALALETRIQELGKEISSRKLAEKQLAAESERFRVTLQSMAEAVLAADKDGQIVLMNRVAEQWVGWAGKDAAGRPVTEVFKLTCPEIGEGNIDLVKWLETEAQLSQASVDLFMDDSRGGQRIVTVSGSRLIDNEQHILGSVLVLRDVTRLRRIEEEVVRGQKLESVGILAGGIAHDFNNLLTAIMGNLSLARIVSSPTDPHYQNIADAEQASLRASELTQQLLTFSRGGSPVKGNVNLEELVRESAEFVIRGSRVQLRFFADDSLWPVKVDRGQIGQVIDNLVINAMQAMPDGGFVDIHLSNYIPGDRSPFPINRQHYVCVEIKDYGVGISKEQQARIFDPYFTTKEVGNGLGLAICFSIVSKHGGHITVSSEPGCGSSFFVYLPALPVESTSSECREDVVSPTQSGSGKRVLVMDDEEIVCSVVSSILEHLGYEVDICSNGSQALAMYSQALEQGRRYDVVIMDVTIPGGMGGQEAVQRLLMIDAEARVIVSSGYSSHEVMADYALYGFAGVVAKPFRINDLSRVLDEVLA